MTEGYITHEVRMCPGSPWSGDFPGYGVTTSTSVRYGTENCGTYYYVGGLSHCEDPTRPIQGNLKVTRIIRADVYQMVYDWYAPLKPNSRRDAFDGGYWLDWDLKNYNNHDTWERPSGANTLYADGHVAWIGNDEMVLYSAGRLHWGPRDGAFVWDSNYVRIDGTSYSYRFDGGLFRTYADLGIW
jgi:prepilin-type processing-associated H-X9-DG protein